MASRCAEERMCQTHWVWWSLIEPSVCCSWRLASPINGTPDFAHSFVRPVDRLDGNWHAPDDLWLDKPPGSHGARRGMVRADTVAVAASFETGTKSAKGRAQTCWARPIFYCWWCCGCRHCCRQRCGDISMYVVAFRRRFIVFAVLPWNRSWFRRLTPATHPLYHVEMCSIMKYTLLLFQHTF